MAALHILFLLCLPLVNLQETEDYFNDNVESADADEVHRDLRADVDGISVCCLINQTKEVTVTSKAVVYAIQAESHERNYTCGLLGLQTCFETFTTYRAAPFYKEVQKSEYRHIDCPKRDIVCCKGYIRVFSQCISLEQIHSHSIG